MRYVNVILRIFPDDPWMWYEVPARPTDDGHAWHDANALGIALERYLRDEYVRLAETADCDVAQLPGPAPSLAFVFRELRRLGVANKVDVIVEPGRHWWKTA